MPDILEQGRASARADLQAAFTASDQPFHQVPSPPRRLIQAGSNSENVWQNPTK
ncbi:MAG: hypothetical protein N838_29920 [Thiohalocapsa sp. PB-PSB1]|nr:MAG: hypothetical protein N838_29920 [Thiohalocapsa sp. PB-PSB1]